MKAYKVFNPDWTCKGFQFEVGKEYKIEGKPVICEKGFHACEKISDCFNYYAFDSQNKVAEVEILGDIVYEDVENTIKEKLVTNHIKITKEISWEEVLQLCNSGNRNSGYRNSGDCNSGDCNSGNRNSGDCNSGNWNSGDRNSGNRNSGDCNSGDCNSGNWNSGNWNSGIFNTNTPDKFRVFNKWITEIEFKNIYFPSFLYFVLTEWVSHDTATKEERKQYKQEIETCGFFLRKLDYKVAFQKAWNNADSQDRIRIKDIPGFDKDLFYEISGINIED